jgi:GDPmannose 4,6-dehydratase
LIGSDLSASSGSGGNGRMAVVVGAGGQDGTLLSAHLRRRGYGVVPVTRQGVLRADGAIEPLDLLDKAAVESFVVKVAPNEIYYLAAHHHSSDEDTGDLSQLLQLSYQTHCERFLTLLEACVRHSPLTRVFYASSALVFGHTDHAPQDETTPMRPVCAYGITKLFGMGLCEVFRRERGLFCSAGILFNHESPLRQPRFVSKKIARAVAAIKRGTQADLVLGSLDSEVDWSAAEDFVRAMPMTLAADVAQDYVFSSGTLRSIGDFCDIAFASVELDFRKYVKVNDNIVFRKPRAVPLQGNPEKLKRSTGWRPEIGFEELVSSLVRAELDQVT